ncbi:hypothetical protein MicloDRAFT_00009990 [Microvirga lotononidis]|uniref:Uncharacterized protein n=1 Tax=Microvirga lotononidis TaxID=864069 RepID=I4Z1V2_9HYPH|nr:hypothetical protein MicloDRAFT_00009990 [Microvirga lotononidis]
MKPEKTCGSHPVHYGIERPTEANCLEVTLEQLRLNEGRFVLPWQKKIALRSPAPTNVPIGVSALR